MLDSSGYPFVIKVATLLSECAKLRVVQPAIDSASNDKFLMRALFADTVLSHHHDPVSVFNRCEAVGNHERRASFGQLGERLLDELFGLGIECRCSFIQNENRRIL